MSKNTFSSAFRKIDVDQYNEDNFKEEEHTDHISSIPEESEVSILLEQGKYLDALKLMLKSAPLSTKNLHVKEKALHLIVKVLLAIRSSQIEEIISQLDTDQLDTLMKYIYKGFEIPSEGSSAHLLVWHEKVFAVGGLGCIVRVLTDNKRVSYMEIVQPGVLSIPIQNKIELKNKTGEHGNNQAGLKKR